MEINDFELNKFELDENNIRGYTHESQFMEICVELFKQVAHLTITISYIAKFDDNGNIIKFNRNEAIIMGNMIRLSKLLIAFIHETCDNRDEILNILTRCIFETILNIKYFIINKSDATVFDSYILSSLATDLKIYQDVLSNIKKNGSKLPIEERIISRFLNSVENSNFTIVDIENNIKHKKIFDKAKEIYSEKSYVYLFSSTSHAIHGNWQDLLDHHIICEDNLYLPKEGWGIPRLQALNAIMVFVIDCLNDYLINIVDKYNEKDFLLSQLNRLLETNNKLNSLHEEFLSRKKNDRQEIQ